MTDSINEAIASRSAHELANELAEHEVSATRSGNYGAADEACEIAGYGTVFDTIEGWVVRDLDGCEDRIDVTELASNLAEIVDWSQRIS